MLRLISDLLDFGKIEAGTFAIEKSEVVVKSIVDTAFETISYQAQDKEVSLIADIADGLSPLICDRDRVIQVLWNLLGNAIKFTPPGGVVRLLAGKGVNGGLQFTVADSGPGIARDELARVFDRFWQAAETATMGCGLGLAIAKGIIESHGGEMWVESELGHGARFHFTIPSSNAPQS